jgi:hypothetical protein
MASIARTVKQTSAKAPELVAHLTAVADQMHALLVQRADELMGCTEKSPEQRELEALANTIEAYEQVAA